MPKEIASAPATEESDETLAMLARQNPETEAFALLLQRTMPLICARVDALIGQNAQHAREDLLQEGMLGFLAAVSTWQPAKGARFRTYCATCVHNRVISALRRGNKDARFAAVSLDDDDLPANAAQTDPQDVFFAMEEARRMAEVIHGQLTVLEKGAMDGYLAGERYETIAARLQTTPKAVDNALQRVRRKLREFI